MNSLPYPRIRALDRLRSLAILLVVLHHSITPYAANGLSWWYVKDSGGIVFFDIMLLLDDTFMMPTLFFVAGYFIPSSMKQNTVEYFSAKARRLVLPLIIGVVFLGPVIAYIRALGQAGAAEGYVSFWLHQYLHRGVEHFHFWFLGVLFVFATLAWLFKPWIRSPPLLLQRFVRNFGAMRSARLYFCAAIMGLLTLGVSRLIQFEQ